MKIKVIVLFVFMLMLCGCENWDDIYSEYKDILDEGINCSYSLISASTPSNYITSITFSGSNRGIYASYNNGGSNLIVNSNSFQNYHEVNGFRLYYNNFDYASFLDNYSVTNTCPSNLYMYSNGDYFIDDTCPSNQTCYTYSTRSSSGNNDSSSNSQDDEDSGKCHIESAIYCKTFSKEILGNTVNIELGFESLSNNTVGRYFVITDQNSMYGGSTARDSNGLTTTYNNNTYIILNPERIYSNNNGDYSIKNIKINYDSTVYYIAAYDDDESQGSIEMGEAEEYDPDAPIVDDGIGNEQSGLDVVEINFCEQNGVRKTFQIVGYILYIAKIMVPLILIILGTIDFAKATISSDDKAPKDALAALVRRIIIAVIIFLIPTILNFLLGLVNGASEAFKNSEFTDCTECLFDPFGDCKAKDIIAN